MLTHRIALTVFAGLVFITLGGAREAAKPKTPAAATSGGDPATRPAYANSVGGSFFVFARWCRSASRDSYRGDLPERRVVGFRVCID